MVYHSQLVVPEKLDTEFVKNIKSFLDLHQINIYSEHLSYCSGSWSYVRFDAYSISPKKRSVTWPNVIKQVEDILGKTLHT